MQSFRRNIFALILCLINVDCHDNDNRPWTKLINSFNHSYRWSNESCEFVMSQTRFFPSKECGFDDRTTKDLVAVPNILITGSARSGTTMIAKLISSLFFPFSNDANSPTEYGMSSWRLAGPTSHDLYRFRHIFHQVWIALSHNNVFNNQ
jgi:hypothetical protein